MIMKKRISYPLVTITILITVLCAPNVARSVPIELDLEILGGDAGTTQGYATICTDIDWDEVLANPDEEYTWWMPTSLVVTADNDSGEILAVLDGISVSIKADPVIELGFAVTAGDYDTAFSFSSPVLTFDPMVNPQARALASVTVGPDDTLIGAYNYEAYRSLYNDSIVFTDLVDTPVGWPGGSESTGWQQILGTVSSMQAKWRFTVTAEGIASGTSYYEIIPEPATVLLLGLGSLVLLRKRNR
jgi:hypothetical protein